MKKLFAVIKNELLRYFTSPLAYVYLVAFLILNGSFAIYFGHFIERGVADLSPMFAFQPWLYLLFITGISMRLWAEEFKSKTIVQIMTMPVSTITLVWGKFLASWIFCVIALLLTFPFVITVNILGEPDNGVILLGYIGSFIVAGAMLAISQTMSALTKNQVIALVLAVIANLIFFLSGLEYVLSVIRPIVPSYITDMVASFSFLTHFNTMMMGLLELRDIIFFASIILLFNFTTVIIIDFKTSGTSAFLQSDNRKSYVVLFAAFLLIFAGINLLANNLLRRIQYDFTEEKIYTLDRNTVNILKNIKNPITIKLYYSPILGKNDPAFRSMFDRIKVLLSQYKAIAGKNFEYKIYTPYPFDRVEDLALGEGIEPLPSVENNSNALFGMTITDDADNKQIIPFLAPERAGFLEYDISEKIFLLSHKKKNLGILTSLPILGGQTENGMIFDRWEIANQLSKFYNLKEIKTAEDFKNIDLLMIVHPKNIDGSTKQSLKEYALSGGKTMIFLDIAPEALRLISSINNKFESSDFDDDLSRFFGFKFYPEYVAADFDNSILVDTSSSYKTNTNFTNDVIQFIVKKDEINPKMPETANLKQIMFSSASVLMPASKDVNFTILVRTSKDSAILPAEVVLDNTNPADILRFYKADDNTKILAARISNKNPKTPIDVIVITDTDFLYDSFWTKIYNLPNSRFIVPILDNANFVLNALETLSGDNYLSSLRGKSAKYRKFNKIERLRRENKLEYSQKELEILDEINNVKQELQNIWARKDFENREMFTPDDLLTIKNIRHELDNRRKALGELKKDSNTQLEQLYLLIKFVDIYLIAIIIALTLLLFHILHKNKRQLLYRKSIFKDRKLLSLCLIACATIVIGATTVYFSNRSNIDLYENKPVFADLSEKINEITEINIKNNQSSVTLSLVDGKWINPNHPEFTIMQEQVRSFLSALIEASYYEKKSNKAENLALFGLLPLEDENSSAIEISLKANDKNIISFLLGSFDMDLGRGSKAAYIRFPQNFQVWMINADFVDVSTDWKQWTLHTMWDLKIGRIKSFDHVSDVNLLTDMTKILINTDLLESVNQLEKEKKLYDILLKDENYNAVYLRIYEANGNHYVKYDFMPPVVGFYAKALAENSKNVYYRFDEKNWGLIDYVKKQGNK